MNPFFQFLLQDADLSNKAATDKSVPLWSPTSTKKEAEHPGEWMWAPHLSCPEKSIISVAGPPTSSPDIVHHLDSFLYDFLP